MDNRPIGIFDSGVGGLTVLSEIKKALPEENYIYLGDTLNFPYGPKSKDEIIKYSVNNVNFLISQNVKQIVIACGTATSQALETLRSNYDIPIIGIIEPTVSYIKSLEIEHVGVIATEGTIRSGAWENEIKKVVPEIEVINRACPMLARVAEEGRARSEEGRKAIKEYMIPFKERKVKNIILGCTHYPIYIPIIKEELGYEVNLINTGKCVANCLKNIFKKENIKMKMGTQKIFLSKHTEEFESISNEILGAKQNILEIKTYANL